MTTNIKFDIFFDTSYQADLENDCACTPSQILNRSIGNPDISVKEQIFETVAQPPSLYTQAISSTHTLAFNLLEQGRPTVLNQPALALLSHFATPQTVTSAEALFPTISRGTIYERVSQLSSLSLLERENAITLIDEPEPSPEVLTVWLHVTNQCNLRCPYCYLHKTPDAMALETGRQSINAVIRSALAHNFKRIKLKFAGGEATLNFSLVAALQSYAQKQAASHNLTLESVILSNGVIVTNRMIDFLQEHRMKLMISLDGIGDYHDRQRPFINGRGSFQQVEKSLDRLIARNFLPDISITISNWNLAGLPETVEYVLQRGLPFSLNFYRENECSATISDLRYANQEIIAAMLKAFAIIEKYLPRRSLLNALVDRANL
ncbi:MAG: radical SAM protein, partial [Pseudomonadota bacterium]|nr:radical SAM protein [Pseudomonadota bacterium]